MSIEDIIERSRRRREADAKRYAELDGDECQLCGAHGEDKRSLFVKCFYAVHEAVPEAIDLFGVTNGADPGYYLRICKDCRGKFLMMLRDWADSCRAKRGQPMNHDGHIDDDQPDATIPTRQFGAIRMVTLDEYEGRPGGQQ